MIVLTILLYILYFVLFILLLLICFPFYYSFAFRYSPNGLELKVTFLKIISAVYEKGKLKIKIPFRKINLGNITDKKEDTALTATETASAKETTPSPAASETASATYDQPKADNVDEYFSEDISDNSKEDEPAKINEEPSNEELDSADEKPSYLAEEPKKKKKETPWQDEVKKYIMYLKLGLKHIPGIFKLFHIKIKKFHLDIGTEEPHHLGYILAFSHMIVYMFRVKDHSIVPCFHSDFLDIEMEIQGFFMLLLFLVFAIKIGFSYIKMRIGGIYG